MTDNRDFTIIKGSSQYYDTTVVPQTLDTLKLSSPLQRMVTNLEKVIRKCRVVAVFSSQGPNTSPAAKPTQGYTLTSLVAGDAMSRLNKPADTTYSL